MGKSTIIIIILCLSSNIFAQKFSADLNYSGLIAGKNYESSSIYTLEGNYEIINNTLSLGISGSIIDARIKNTFITNPTPDNPIESALKLGVQCKYYPFVISFSNFKISTFAGIEIGKFLANDVKPFPNMPTSCEETYRFDLPNDFYSNFSLGMILFPKKVFSFRFGLQYQIQNSKIKYEKPICNFDKPTVYKKYEETVNLNMLLWNIVFEVNF